MKGLLSALAVLALGVMALIFVSGGMPAVLASTTSFGASTTSVTGFLAPDGAHFNVGVSVLVWALLGVGLFTIMARVLDLHGDVIVTLALVGLVFGSLFGMLSLGNSTVGNSLPFALPVVAGVDLILWLWQGSGK